MVALWHFEVSGSQSSPTWSVQNAGIWNCRCHDSGSFCLVLELTRLDTMSSTDLKVQKAGDWESYPRTSIYRYPTWLAWKLARIYLHQELSCQNLLCICDRTWASIQIFCILLQMWPLIIWSWDKNKQQCTFISRQCMPGVKFSLWESHENSLEAARHELSLNWGIGQVCDCCLYSMPHCKTGVRLPDILLGCLSLQKQVLLGASMASTGTEKGK